MNSISDRGGSVVVTVEEARLDAANAVSFKDDFLNKVGRGKPVVLDLGKVQFLDSSGLGALVAVLKIFSKETISLCCLQPAVEKVMTLTRMNKVFSIYGCVDEAVAEKQANFAEQDG